MDLGSNKGYHCDYCNKEYRLQTSYNNHVAFCEFSHKSMRDQEDDLELYDTIPTQKEMFVLLRKLVCRVTKLEKENTKLRHFVSKENKKIDILEWLNQNKKLDISFREWILGLNYQDCVAVVFEKDMTAAILQALEDGYEKYIQNVDCIPIRVFLQKKNLFYIYNKEHSTDVSPSWYVLSDEILYKWINYIVQRIVGSFADWFDNQLQENPSERNTLEENKNKYYQKIFCTKMNEETRNQRVRQHFYKMLQKNSKHIAEYGYDLS